MLLLQLLGFSPIYEELEIPPILTRKKLKKLKINKSYRSIGELSSQSKITAPKWERQVITENQFTKTRNQQSQQLVEILEG